MSQSDMPDICERCITDRSLCDQCKDSVKYRRIIPSESYFKAYQPACPLGTTDCIRDPAYIKCHYPDWYEHLYGDMKPEEAAEKTCSNYAYPCRYYDDEDK